MTVTHSTIHPLKYGLYTISYHTTEFGSCVSVSYGNLQRKTPIVRLHSACLFGEALGGLECECADQLTSTLKIIKKNKSGVLVYSYAEGRGIGLENKIRALELQRTQKLNTVEAFKQLGFESDVRTYEKEIAALNDLKVSRQIHVATQNPRKLAALKDAGFEVVERVSPVVKVTKHNIENLIVKKELLGYHISIEPQTETA